MVPSPSPLPFPGKLVMVGFGSIGQATLPLLLRHSDLTPQRITIISAHDHAAALARQQGTTFLAQPLTRTNYRAVLEPLLEAGDFLLNLSVEVSSLALLQLCHERGALYLDTCTEPWPGLYSDRHNTPSQRSNYALREEMLAFRRNHPVGPTAVITQGANPGLASAFVKQALLNLARDNGICSERPSHHAQWAALAERLGIRAIHVAERDTQLSAQHKRRGEFVNTWSVRGFVSEAVQPVELGWGTHERHWPADAARHGFGCDAAIYLHRPGAATRVHSWTPLEGSYLGMLITHSESISIADHLTLREHGAVVYRPTVHYAYHPCDDALLSLHELAGKNWQPQAQRRILRDEITEGMDELGVLLMGNAKGVYWYGSRLTIEEARRLAPHNNATSLQVVAGILGGISWALANPTAGIVEPDDIDHQRVLEIATPYLGEMVGVYGDWTPLQRRGELFREVLDMNDPWQFVNMRVV
ncbi:MAG TPA: saccharopine dehydrogenase NADP-binding domain-containing protein [Gammaproteobacteria bacterium]